MQQAGLTARSCLAGAIGSEAQVSLPMITVVTPVFNGATYLAETLESVLRQDYPALEYIVVDGGSTDGTLDIIARYEARDDFRQRITRVISEPDQGMYDALAKGFAHASGDIYCYLNADDLFEPGALRAVAEFFLQHPQVQLIYHEDIVLVDGWKYPNVRQPENVDTVSLLNGHILFQDGVFWRRAAYEAVGGMRRDLKLAGDFDFWLRLSDRFGFVKRAGYVSCFRMRPGQLSNRREEYREEMMRSIRSFLVAAPPAKRLRREMQKFVWHVARKPFSGSRRERLFFPIDFGNLPPPMGKAPLGAEEIPRSPIDGQPAERFLFTTPDTRFGECELNYIYLDERHEIAIAHPRIPAQEVDALYLKHYSCPPTEVKPPGATSPYRRFNGKRGWEKALLMLPFGTVARAVFSRAWLDNTFSELIGVVKKANVDSSKILRFLDVGCFEGNLLDAMRRETRWELFGLEPNRQAVEKARGKGHRVWCGHAEDAGVVIPMEQEFDVIYMGQSIEHVEDPFRVLLHLERLLARDGIIVVSTPNLDSREIDWFGPTWAHWHAPYHRYIFSKKGLCALAEKAGLQPICVQSFSHPYWTAMSLALNRAGLGGSVSHAVEFDSSITTEANKIYFWKRLIWNRRDQGDYLFCVFKVLQDVLA